MNKYAFPIEDFDPGMLLRDYFAAAAMQGYMGYSKASMTLDEVAAWSYKVADALLKAREA